MTLPRGATLKFCRRCNARERLIFDGRCSVCGCRPDVRVPAQ